MFRIMLNRRSKMNRRVHNNPPDADLRGADRRFQANNGYVLMIGKEGFDAFSVFVLMPIVVVVSIAFLVGF